ncbi:MAG: ATP-binding cassette domain-containing protein [Thermoplasmata archaeon]|nr:MAG: ATP-binding cassette domain-containing protein [Thermoplasmata archaeon]
MDGDIVIRLEGLTKRFDDLVAVDGVDLEIPRGEIFGLLGPNGAGKTTIIRMLGGLTLPTAGGATVLGLDIVKDTRKVKDRIGVVPQNNVLDRDINVLQNLRYHGKLHNIPRGKIDGKIDDVLDFTELKAKRDAKIDELSGGMKRRLVVAKAMMHDPEVFILDEPTTGLDPQSRRMVWEKVRSFREMGMTMILTTHYMDEADALCDRIGIIDHGKVIALGTPEDLKASLGAQTVLEVKVYEGTQDAILAGLEVQPFTEDVFAEGDKVMLRTNDKKAAAVHMLTQHADDVETLQFREPTLEDVFIELTGRELRE